jgi:hypothetical protein
MRNIGSIKSYDIILQILKLHIKNVEFAQLTEKEYREERK